MDKQLHKQLLHDTEELRSLVAKSSTESIVGMCAAHFMRTNGPEAEHSPLPSPSRQISFLLGLMLTTAEPENPREFGSEEWNRAIELLNAIVNAYASMFWPALGELGQLTNEWRETRLVAMSAFIHYFNTTILASIEQISDRIRRYLIPFDNHFQNIFGLRATEALEVIDWIAQRIQSSIDDLFNVMQKEEIARLALLNRTEAEGWDLQHLQHEAQSKDYLPHAISMVNSLNSIYKISLQAITDQFGQRIADSYWNLFVTSRGEVKDYTYFTERNIAEEKPLFEIEKGIAYCPLANVLYTSLLKVYELELSKGKKKDIFLRKRDRVFEAEVEEKMRSFFGDTARFFANVFETKELHFEHDLIFYLGRRLFVVEAKASPPVEPFRDPGKAFTRLKRAFQCDTGIQNAYEQANRIRQQLIAGNPVDLYDSEGNQVAHLKPQDFDTVYCICVTRDDFGPLAVDLSLLLEKEENVPYPWAINIFDLDSIFDAWNYFGWGPERLCEYLDDRIQLNGKLLSFDELELAGCFVQHGSISHLVQAKADRVHLVPQYSDIFDRIYEARHGGEPIQYAPTEPFLGNVREILSEMLMEEETKDTPPTTFQSTKKQGRNDPCACGSGKKYKRCCGRNR